MAPAFAGSSQTFAPTLASSTDFSGRLSGAESGVGTSSEVGSPTLVPPVPGSFGGSVTPMISHTNPTPEADTLTTSVVLGTLLGALLIGRKRTATTGA